MPHLTAHHFSRPQRPALVKGNMQLYSVEQQRSQALEAHAAAFGTLKVLPFFMCPAVALPQGLSFAAAVAMP